MTEEHCKINDILYLHLNLERMKLINEKDFIKNFPNKGNNSLKIRILTNQSIKVNYDPLNLQNSPILEEPLTKEINFFGLLLKVRKEFLIPSCNLIIHINGGGVLNQSSESHLCYLNK